ncbi:hypothetical protein PTKIN_Ptkin10aG0126400 [Pterospermum kingtungense]
MSRQPGLMKAVVFLLLLLSIFVNSKSSDGAESVKPRSGLKLATSLGEMKGGSSSFQTMQKSGPSPSGPGHKSSEAPSLGFPRLSGPRPEEGLLHFSRIHH